jgi:hypothetical protein
MTVLRDWVTEEREDEMTVIRRNGVTVIKRKRSAIVQRRVYCELKVNLRKKSKKPLLNKGV